MTSSAHWSRDEGIVRPSVLAVITLTANSMITDRSTAKVPGSTPLRILLTYTAAWRNRARISAPYDISAPFFTYPLLDAMTGRWLVLAKFKMTLFCRQNRGLSDRKIASECS